MLAEYINIIKLLLIICIIKSSRGKNRNRT